MSVKSEDWLLVEWSEGGRDITHAKLVLNPRTRDLEIGGSLTALDRTGKAQTATLISRANDLSVEKDQLIKMNEAVAGPSPKPDDGEDFSPSEESSWEPSNDEVSADSDQESNKKIKLDHCRRQYYNRRRSKKILTPLHRANAVIPKIMQNSVFKKNESLKRAHSEIRQKTVTHNSLPDSTKRNNSSDTKRQMVQIDARELEEISNSFRVLFRMIEELKRPLNNSLSSVYKQPENISLINETLAANNCEETEVYEQDDEFNSSADNVLITNKYDNLNKAKVSQESTPNIKKEMKAGDEWVPIGSGKTLIHADQFRKVNWKSYTVATRTLLLAVFPRRILATHSLTGKQSPAFQNKPAKMCLDPKIITDVVIEIMDRFDVKENLVRSIITTKCADECKMWKQRAKKKTSTSRQRRSLSNLENEEPDKGNFQRSNETVA